MGPEPAGRREELTVSVSDPWAALRLARRRYAEALARRRSLEPGEPGYRDAVHELGVAWAQVRRWERETQARTDPRA
jgi:hypothetical protein